MSAYVESELPRSPMPRALRGYKLVVRLGSGRLTETFLATRELPPLGHEPVVVHRLHKHPGR